jgi:ribosomal protein S17E
MQGDNFNHSKLPKVYNNCFFAALAETSTDITVITEKVITPILFLKPFIVLGDKGYHQFLKSLGFELFEEFIDYSFDFEHNEDRRIEMFCEQVKNVSELSADSITELNQKISQKRALLCRCF